MAFQIEDTEIRIATDLYHLYNDWLTDAQDAAKKRKCKYAPSIESNCTIEKIRDNYTKIFERIPHKNYGTCKEFEGLCKKLGLIEL